MISGTPIPYSSVKETPNLHISPRLRALPGLLRSNAPSFIDLSLAKSQKVIERDFPDDVPKNMVWEPVYVDGLPINEENVLTHESYRKNQRLIAVAWQTHVKNNESYGYEEQDLPEAPDYLSHYQFGDAYVWAIWEKEARKNLMGVKLYLQDHPEKKEELQTMILPAKSYWNKNPSDFERYFPLTPELNTKSG